MANGEQEEIWARVSARDKRINTLEKALEDCLKLHVQESGCLHICIKCQDIRSALT